MSKDIDLIKERIDFIDFMRSYITLHPAGKNFKALCPFHQEKTPSFIFSTDRKRWHCFGCGADGDLVTFLMKYENLEFPEALRVLAEKAGIELHSINPAVQKEYGLLYSIHDDAMEFYKSALTRNDVARGYLKSRGLTEETIEMFGIGFAPVGDALVTHLIKKGYDVLDIARAGLTYKTQRGLYYDRFQDRIVFPVANHLGRVVAFTGRLMPDVDGEKSSFAKASEDKPKYLNSPETPIFNKSKILYGLNHSKRAIAESRTAVLVEGQMDFLMAFQSGVENVVAVSGTGLTPLHLERLRRLADSIIINFDNDEAGLKALERALDVFSDFDFHLKVLDLGEFKDAAEACATNSTFLRERVEWAKPAFTHLFNFYFGSGKTLSIPEKKRVLRYLLIKIKALRSAVEQNIWIKDLAAFSGIGEHALSSELAALVDVKKESEEEASSTPSPRSRVDLISGRLLSLGYAKADFLKELRAKRDIFPAVYHPLLDDSKSDIAQMFDMKSSFEFQDSTPEDLTKEFADLLRNLELEYLKERRSTLQDQMRKKGGVSEENLAERMTEFYSLSKKIDEIQGAV